MLYLISEQACGPVGPLCRDPVAFSLPLPLVNQGLSYSQQFVWPFFGAAAISPNLSRALLGTAGPPKNACGRCLELQCTATVGGHTAGSHVRYKMTATGNACQPLFPVPVRNTTCIR